MKLIEGHDFDGPFFKSPVAMAVDVDQVLYIAFPGRFCGSIDQYIKSKNLPESRRLAMASHICSSFQCIEWPSPAAVPSFSRIGVDPFQRCCAWRSASRASPKFPAGVSHTESYLIRQTS